MSRNEIEAFIQEHADYLKNQNIKGIMGHYSEASLFWEACGSSLKGKDEICSWFKAMFDQYRVDSIRYDIVAIRCTETSACCAIIYEIQGGSEKDDTPISGNRVKVTYCLEKTDNIWQLWHVHGSRW